MLTKPASSTTITLWNGREIPRLGMGCWAIGGPFFAGDTPLGWGDVDDDESVESRTGPSFRMTRTSPAA